MLISHTNGRRETFGQCSGCGDRAGEDHPRTIQDDRILGRTQKLSGGGNRIFAARRSLENDRVGNLDVNDLGPESPAAG